MNIKMMVKKLLFLLLRGCARVMLLAELFFLGEIFDAAHVSLE